MKNIKQLIMLSVLGLATLLSLNSTSLSQTRHQQKDRIVDRERIVRHEPDRTTLPRRVEVRRERFVFRNGTRFQLDFRNEQLLRNAINFGYQRGYDAALLDRSRGLTYDYSRPSAYIDGTFGYVLFGNRGLYQFYFREGFRRGYEDGYFRRHSYGSSINGSLTISNSVLNSIFEVNIN